MKKKTTAEECAECPNGFTVRTCLYQVKDRPCSRLFKGMANNYPATSQARLLKMMKRKGLL
jgi:hypothetical protein